MYVHYSDINNNHDINSLKSTRFASMDLANLVDLVFLVYDE